MKAVISVLGKDMVGILARVSTICAQANANVVEVTQSLKSSHVQRGPLCTWEPAR